MSEDERKAARRARNLGATIAMTMILWVGVQLAGATFGLPPMLVFVADIAALAVFGWALYATYRVWKLRRDQGR